MKPLTALLIALAALVALPTPALSGRIQLRYGFSPGQQWECKRMSHMEFMVMGQKQVQRQKHTLLYTVSKGQKKGWVRLTARYIDPPAKTRENRFAMGQYDLVFTADFHHSGDTRNIKVEGVDKYMNDDTLLPQEKMAMAQTNKMLAQSLKQVVFWFPELSEEALEPGDEFEERRTHGIKDPNMTAKSKHRATFTLEEVSGGLAYFTTKERLSGKTTTMGGAMDTKSAGKGETIFDLKAGMWIEFVAKRKMSFAGAMMGGQNGQEMYMTEKVVMQLR